jgi:hypothetical protein
MAFAETNESLLFLMHLRLSSIFLFFPSRKRRYLKMFYGYPRFSESWLRHSIMPPTPI